MGLVTKRIFLASETCLTKGWYLRSSGIEIPLTPSAQARIDVGNEIGVIARTLYPQGILLNEGNNLENAHKTKALMSDQTVTVIFEATFIYGDLIARADILKRINNEWHLIEVKSSSSKDKISADFIDDLAYTTTIMRLCGITPTQTSLLLISKEYRLGMEMHDFFVETDCTQEVNLQSSKYIQSTDKTAKATSETECPPPTLIIDCKKCDFY
jgi:CRISPR/Cas system-associated exonuclease Cas4 (RecB family)